MDGDLGVPLALVASDPSEAQRTLNLFPSPSHECQLIPGVHAACGRAHPRVWVFVRAIRGRVVRAGKPFARSFCIVSRVASPSHDEPAVRFLPKPEVPPPEVEPTVFLPAGFGSVFPAKTKHRKSKKERRRTEEDGAAAPSKRKRKEN